MAADGLSWSGGALCRVCAGGSCGAMATVPSKGSPVRLEILSSSAQPVHDGSQFLSGRCYDPRGCNDVVVRAHCAGFCGTWRKHPTRPVASRSAVVFAQRCWELFSVHFSNKMARVLWIYYVTKALEFNDTVRVWLLLVQWPSCELISSSIVDHNDLAAETRPDHLLARLSPRKCLSRVVVQRFLLPWW